MKTLLKNRNVLLLIALGVIGLAFELLTRDAQNSFLSARSISTVFRQASVIGVLACGMTYIIILRHIDLSVGSALAFLGGLTAWLMAPRPEPIDPALAELGLYAAGSGPTGLALTPCLAIAAVCLMALVLWGLKGVIQCYTGMPAFIITLGGMMGYRGLSYLIAKREIPIADENLISRVGTEYLDIQLGWIVLILFLTAALVQVLRDRRRLVAAVPLLLLAAVVLFLQLPHEGIGAQTRGLAYITCVWAIAAMLTAYLAQSTVYGRHMYAAGGNPEAARLCGINVTRVNILAFLVMGFLTALAALMYLGQQGTAESSAGQLAELDAIAACVIGGVSLQGGKGSISGTVLGTLIMQSLTSGLYQCNVESGYQMLIKAGVLIAVVGMDHLLSRK